MNFFMPGSSPHCAISFLLDVVTKMYINYDTQGPLIGLLYDGASRRTSGEVLTRRTSDGDPGGLPPGSVRGSLGGLRPRSGGADRRMGVYRRWVSLRTILHASSDYVFKDDTSNKRET